jgi:hypothetical protein
VFVLGCRKGLRLRVAGFRVKPRMAGLGV